MAVYDLTSNVLQRNGNTCGHLSWGAKGPVSQLLIRTNTLTTHTKKMHIINVLNP